MWCLILERSFSPKPLQLPIVVCCTVAQWCSSYLTGYQHCPRSLTRLTYLPTLPLPTSPAYSPCIASPSPQPCILSNDCDISALDISIVVSDSSTSAHNILLGHLLAKPSSHYQLNFAPHAFQIQLCLVSRVENRMSGKVPRKRRQQL